MVGNPGRPLDSPWIARDGLVSRQASLDPALPFLQAPAPCPEGATRIAGRASAMFGQLDKASRATLLAFAGHPQLDQVDMTEV